jgi:uncharacterized RDD family membrane protein YckC
MTSVPPGWYADPAAPPHAQAWLRWWDGFAWTGHVAPGAARRSGDSAPTTADGVPLAGWGWRVLAYLLDVVIVALPNALVTLPAQLDLQRKLQTLTRELDATSTNGQPPDLAGFFHDYFDLWRSHALGLLLPGVLITTVYFAAMWRWRGATVGQLVTGLKVRPVGGPGRLSWTAIGLRAGVLYLFPTLLGVLAFLSGSWLVVLLVYAVILPFQLLNVLWPLWDGRRQALHDKAAGTVVVRPAPVEPPLVRG